MGTARVPPRPERELLERAVHDLKNPLAVVRASLEWLEVELDDREDALDAVRDATSASDRIMTLVDDLDVLARLGEEGLASGQPVPIVPLVTSVVATASTRLAPRGITVEAIGPRGPLETIGDARLLGRALGALVDATSRGAATGACIEVTVAETASSSGDCTIEIGVALRSAALAGAPGPASDMLERASLGVLVALHVIELHGGSLDIVATTTLPRVIVRLPG